MSAIRKARRLIRILRLVWREIGLRQSLAQFVGIVRLSLLRAEMKLSSPPDPPSPPEPLPTKPKGSRPLCGSLKVLILNGFPDDWALYRYRVKQKIEQLRAVGVEVNVIHFDSPDLVPTAMQHSHAILYRLPITERLMALASESKKKGLPLIFDIDDLIFDLQICQQIDGVQILNDLDKEEYLRNMARIGEAMKLCEFGLVPTLPLKERLEGMGLKTYVHRNGVEAEMIGISERAVQGKIEKDGVIVSYLSGSNTHNRDFQICSSALAEILRKYDFVWLYIFGWLTTDDLLKPYESRIVRVPFMPWKELAVFAKDADINLSPLEKNEFCNSKSELKYLEAGILEVPTIASPRQAFSEVIRHGENGFLAETHEEWAQCLDFLIRDKTARIAMGKKAREHILDRYHPQKMGEGLADYLRSV
jgi:glycosyltransferase involved in cell wall biosynthesis